MKCKKEWNGREEDDLSMEYLSPEPTLDNKVYEIIYDQLRLMNRDMLFYKEVL